MLQQRMLLLHQRYHRLLAPLKKIKINAIFISENINDVAMAVNTISTIAWVYLRCNCDTMIVCTNETEQDLYQRRNVFVLRGDIDQFKIC